MEVRAIAKYIKVQPRKVRIVADEIRGKSAVQSAHLLRFHSSKGARTLRKVLVSAIANAMENHQLAAEALVVRTILVDEGPRMKRITQKAMGRGARIVKKTAHITVVVEDEQQAAGKSKGPKPKARPKFDAPKKAKATPKSEAKTAETEPVAEAAAEVEEVMKTPAVTEEAPEQAPVEETPAPESEESKE